MNKKAQGFIIIFIIISIIVTGIVVFTFTKATKIEEKVKISLVDGIEYSSNLEMDDERNLRTWFISNLILKILIGITAVIIAIAILLKYKKRRKI